MVVNIEEYPNKIIRDIPYICKDDGCIEKAEYKCADCGGEICRDSFFHQLRFQCVKCFKKISNF